MKNVILICSAAIALTLSFFFEVAPETTAAPLPGSVIETASLVPFAPEGDGKPANVFEKAARTLSFKDSLAYKYYAQNFNVKLDYNEDQALLETINDWIGTPYRSGSNTKKRNRLLRFRYPGV